MTDQEGGEEPMRGKVIGALYPSSFAETLLFSSLALP